MNSGSISPLPYLVILTADDAIYEVGVFIGFHTLTQVCQCLNAPGHIFLLQSVAHQGWMALNSFWPPHSAVTTEIHSHHSDLIPKVELVN